jgi:general secretion pathway protein J
MNPNLKLRLPHSGLHRQGRRTNQQGLTLIELLVTMVILGFVIATMSGALNQISQMLRISAEQTNGFLGRWTQSRALFDIVANMTLDPTLDQPFTGNPNRMDLVSLATPNAPLGQPQRLRLQLDPVKDQANQTQLQVSELDADAAASAPQWLADFQGRIEFRYIDRQQQEHSQWPINNGQQTQKIPSAIVLRDSASQALVVRMVGYMGPVNPTNQLGQALLGRP